MIVSGMDLLSLEELQQDSPLFRAKTYDLLRRAERLATSCQDVLRHSNEVSSRRRGLQEAEDTWESSMQQLCHVLAYRSIQEDTCAAREGRSDDEIEAWQTRADEPIHRILASCEKVRNVIESFEEEIQGYYAATGRWLAEVRSSSVQQQQDRSQEQQELRELRFLLARHRIYAAMLHLHECSISANFTSLMQTSPIFASADDDSAVRQPFDEGQSDPPSNSVEQLKIRTVIQVCQSKMSSLQQRINDAEQQPERTSPDARPSVAQGAVEAEHRRQRRISGVFDLLRAVKATSIDSPPHSRLSSLRTEPRTASIDITKSLEHTSRPILPPRQRSDSLLGGAKRLSVPLAAIHKRVPSLKGRKLRAEQANIDPSSESCASSSIGNGGQPFPSTESASSLLASASRKREGVLWLASKRALSITNEDAPLYSTLPWKESWVVLAGTGHLTENDHWRFNDGDRSHSGSAAPSMIDLRLATVRRARGLSASSFAFEVVTMDGKRKLYQATSEQETQLWMASIGLAIESLFNSASSIRRIDRASASLAEMSNAEAARPNSIYSSGQSPLWTQSLIDLTERPTLLSPTKLVSTGANFLKHARRRSRVDSSLDRPVAASIMEAAEPIAEMEVLVDPTRISSSFSASSASGSSPLDRTSSLETNRISWAISDSIPSSLLQKRPVESAEIERTILKEATLSDLDEADRRIAEMVNERYGGRSRSLECSRVETLAGDGPAAKLADQSKRILQLPFPSQVQESQSPASSEDNKDSLALEIDHLSRLPENSTCADCRAPNPRWTASLSSRSPPGCLIFICIACAGQHRSLGVAVSRVKSVNLDDWNEEWVQRARDWGNSRANAVWEAKRNEESKSAGIRGAGDFWKMKYLDEVWKVGKEEGSDL